jgi:hypothetical protein
MLLAFDIGIKHLAYCVGDVNGKDTLIRHWSLVNLQDLNDSGPVKCATCSKPAKKKGPKGPVCGRHTPKDAPQIFDEKTGKAITRAPTIAQMQAFLRARNLDTKGQKDALMTRVEAVAYLPLPKKQKATSFADNTCGLHDAICGWIDRDWDRIKGVTKVYLEHQPVYKNPVMKTVQILLFATLRTRFIHAGLHPAFHFVHAGKKVKGAESGDAGYKDRKAGAEARVKSHLSKFPICSDQQDWLRWWLAQPKRDDLADAVCMVLDASVASA